MARIIHHNGTVEECSDSDFYSRIFGPPRTKAEREAEWRAEIERFADMIERGNEWAVPPPCLADARKLVAERAARLGKPYSELKRTGTGGFWL